MSSIIEQDYPEPHGSTGSSSPPRQASPSQVVQGEVLEMALSPSLRSAGRGAGRAYEQKFLLDEPQAREVEALLRRRLALDPHAQPALDGAYAVTSLYCDTPQFDVFHRLGTHKYRKFRIRRYGDESIVYLERKDKRGAQVRKRRAFIDELELPRLAGFPSDAPWSGLWFHQQLLDRRMQPVCCVRYLRTAYVGQFDDGPVRLTFDRQVRAEPGFEWTLSQNAAGTPVLPDQVICEFKYRGALPLMFKSAIETLKLSPQGVSKYRYSLRALGTPGDGSPPHA
ncbi:MAG: polyphosphate polymerase domain-containing protein [Planctomycetales bacterium]